MADSRFFKKSASLTVAEIASLSGAEPSDPSDTVKNTVIEDIAPLDKAGPGQLSFLDNIRYREGFKNTKASACFVSPELAGEAPEGLIPLITKTPYKAYALTAQAFYPDSRPDPSLAESARIDGLASLGMGCVVGECAVIGSGAEIGDNCWIEAGVVIGDNVKLGDGCRVGANATISHSVIGDNVRIYPGARIGQDGFGFAIDPAGHVKVPQLGRVIIEDSVEIGANSCIDRGAGPDTVIGRGTWIDNLVQIGHNVRIGKGCVIVSQVGISGSTVIEDYAVLAGQVGVAGHLRIGMGARIAAQSGIMRDVPPGEEQMGYPAVPIKQFMRQTATISRLTKKKGTSTKTEE